MAQLPRNPCKSKYNGASICDPRVPLQEMGVRDRNISQIRGQVP